jgi:hypothetical protein
VVQVAERAFCRGVPVVVHPTVTAAGGWRSCGRS